jgi:hypothetical protein
MADETPGIDFDPSRPENAEAIDQVASLLAARYGSGWEQFTPMSLEQALRDYLFRDADPQATADRALRLTFFLVQTAGLATFAYAKSEGVSYREQLDDMIEVQRHPEQDDEDDGDD